MNENYTTQILDSNPGASNAQAFFPQGDYLLDEDILKVHKRKNSKHTKKLKRRIKELETQQQLLALALWRCQASISAEEQGRRRKKGKHKKGKKGKKNKQPKWLDHVLVQTLPTIITESFNRMLPPSQSQSMLALPDGRNHQH